MSAIYNGLEFKTRLEAQWAAFFDLADWQWWLNPPAVSDWRPDFKVRFKCDHSECCGSHSLLVAVLPVHSIEAFGGHPCLSHIYGVSDSSEKWIADAGAAFGSSPSITRWTMAHGAGGGTDNVQLWVPNAWELWIKAAAMVSSDRSEKCSTLYS